MFLLIVNDLNFYQYLSKEHSQCFWVFAIRIQQNCCLDTFKSHAIQKCTKFNEDIFKNKQSTLV